MNLEAKKVALLVRAPTASLDEAAAEIEAYADRKAQAAVERAIQYNNRALSRIFDMIESPLAPRRSADA